MCRELNLVKISYNALVAILLRIYINLLVFNYSNILLWEKTPA